jgi:hypothetical protein
LTGGGQHGTAPRRVMTTRVTRGTTSVATAAQSSEARSSHGRAPVLD